MCIDAQMLSAYLDGELKEPYRTQVEEHLEYCSACRHHLEDMKALDERISGAAYPQEELTRKKDQIFQLLDKKYFQEGKKVSFIRRRFYMVEREVLSNMKKPVSCIIFAREGHVLHIESLERFLGKILCDFQVVYDMHHHLHKQPIVGIVYAPEVVAVCAFYLHLVNNLPYQKVTSFFQEWRPAAYP